MATVKTPRKPRIKTNEQMLNAFLKSCNSFEIMLVVERLNCILNETAEDIKRNPNVWKRCIIHPDAYLRLVEKAREHMDHDSWVVKKESE